MSKLALAVVIIALLIFFIYKDSKIKNYSPFLPILLVVITLFVPYLAFITLPIFFILRQKKNIGYYINLPKQKTRLCSKCGFENSPSSSNCSSCGNKLDL